MSRKATKKATDVTRTAHTPADLSPAPAAKNLRTNAQNRAMHALAAQRGLAHEDLQTLAGEVTKGKTQRTSELTFRQANQVIEKLGGQPLPDYGKTPRRTQNYRRRNAGITAKSTVPTELQIAHIRTLAEKRNMSEEGLERLATRMNINWPPKTCAGAQGLTEALKSMIKRDKAQKEAA